MATATPCFTEDHSVAASRADHGRATFAAGDDCLPSDAVLGVTQGLIAPLEPERESATHWISAFDFVLTRPVGA
jgi:hypothetical protein